MVESWDGATAFFSTSIAAVTKEREEKKRERDRLTGARNPNAACNYRSEPDFENAGVGIVIKDSLLNSVKNVRQISGRIMSLTFSSHGFDVMKTCSLLRTLETSVECRRCLALELIRLRS